MVKKAKKSNYVSLSAASKILNVTPETMRNWDKQGKLTASRNPINNYRLYDLEDLHALANESQVSESTINYSTLFDDGSSLKSAIKSMSRAFRDSEGGSLLDRFEEISKLLFCKLYDEEFNNGKGFSSIVSKNKVEVNYDQICNLFSKAIKKHPTVFVNGRAELSLDKKAICQVSLILKNYELKTINNDIKGKIYEELIKNTLDKNENQQFFTPRSIVQFIIDLINPEVNHKICDPACGSGGFLISALEYIKRNNNFINLKEFSKTNLSGIEIDSRMVWIAQMNIILHGGHYESIQYLKSGGSLSHEKEATEKLPNNSFDIIITNPPFGSDYDLESDLNKFELGKGKKSRRRGVLFVEKCLNLLKTGGKLAIVLEESILNNTSNEDVRNYIVNNSKIEAIISLPDTTFMPYATVKTSIIIASKKKSGTKVNGDILMCNIEKLGFAPNGDPIYSDERNEKGKLKLLSDFPEALETYREFIRTGKLENRSEKYFITKTRFNEKFERLDTLFHHPSKQTAQEFLTNTKYPLYRIGELVTIINKLVVPQHEMTEDIVRYIGLANINSFDGAYYISEILGEKIKSAVKMFEPNTIIYSKMRPELRKVIYVPVNEEIGFVSSECYVFKASNKILPQYLALVLRSDLVFGQIIFRVTGLGRPRIGKEDLLSVRIPVPPIEKQSEIISIFNAYETNRNALLEKSRMLQQQANSIVRKSFEEIGTTLCR
ncbi:MAG: N-6 DNA methylase [Ignavibacteriaceae bacterium]|nr:N-6 DNA methylase [Ignavibacteriaceae bacterium]